MATKEVRFAFGKNWASFLEQLTEARIEKAQESLRSMLNRERFDGLSFLDIGSGSGLFSLAARRLGATVVSFDYDRESVACTRELRRRYFPEDRDWEVHEGSVLDDDWMASLGTFDVVYSWGVLHHTGAMWPALDNACRAVKAGGMMFIAIYNDQGWRSRIWTRVKRAYTSSSPILRPLIGLPFFIWLWGKQSVADLLRAKPFDSWRNYQSLRGMSAWHDFVDWIGGYPFEVASPEAIFDSCHTHGFALEKLRTVRGSLGCNEFVFHRLSQPPGDPLNDANITYQDAIMSVAEREQLLGQRGAVVWLTGLSGSGKSSIAHAAAASLLGERRWAYVLDGDNVRHGLNADLRFSPADRAENVRRLGEVAALFADACAVVLVAAISPYAADRDAVRARVGEDRFLEVFVDAPLQACEERDPKGLYRKARAGEILDFTGVHAPYERPIMPALTLHSDQWSVNECAGRILVLLRQRGTWLE